MKAKKRPGPRVGTKYKLASEKVTDGRRLTLYMLPWDHARLQSAAAARSISAAALAREAILRQLPSAT